MCSAGGASRATGFWAQRSVDRWNASLAHPAVGDPPAVGSDLEGRLSVLILRSLDGFTQAVGHSNLTFGPQQREQDYVPDRG